MTERGSLSAAQVAQLLQPIKRNRILVTQGQSYVAAWDVVAHLNRMFGFGGWDKEILSLDVVFEDKEERTKGQKSWTAWTVTYRCVMRLTVFDPEGRIVAVREDGATGTGNAQPQRGEAHDLAMKNAISYAIKRCAKDLGDQFGLGLYNGGKMDAVVRNTLVMPGADAAPADVQEGVPAPVGLGNDERQEVADPDELVPVAEASNVGLAKAKQEVLDAVAGDRVAALRAWSHYFPSAQLIVARKDLDWALADIKAKAEAS